MKKDLRTLRETANSQTKPNANEAKKAWVCKMRVWERLSPELRLRVRKLRGEEIQSTTMGQGTQENAVRITCCLWRNRTGQTQTIFKMGQVFVANQFGHKIGSGQVSYNPVHPNPIFLHSPTREPWLTGVFEMGSWAQESLSPRSTTILVQEFSMLEVGFQGKNSQELHFCQKILSFNVIWE